MALEVDLVLVVMFFRSPQGLPSSGLLHSEKIFTGFSIWQIVGSSSRTVGEYSIHGIYT